MTETFAMSESQTFLTFYSVLNHSDIGKHFCNFLKMEKKEEKWKFVVSVQLFEGYSKSANKTKANKQMKQILSYFHEKNLKEQTDETKDVFRKILEKKIDESDSELYSLIIDLKNKLVSHFEKNEFQRFNSTKEAKKLCKTYERSKLLVLPILAQEFQYKNEDFEKIIFSKKDFEFFQKLEKEKVDDWEHIVISEKMKIHICHHNYLPQVSFLDSPQFVKKTLTYKCNFQEAAFGVLYKYFENNPNCVFFKTVEYNKDSFIIDHYLKRPNYHIRVTRMICTLIYEDGTIFALMKPLKIPELEFLAFKDMKFFKQGEEVIQQGVQDFFFIGVRIIPISSNEVEVHASTLFQGRFGSMGVPKHLLTLKSTEFYNQFDEGIKLAKGKKIKDFKDECNKIKHGLPLNPFAKMLYDLNIDQFETSPTLKKDEKNSFPSPKKSEPEVKSQKRSSKNMMSNILNVLKINDKKLVENNFLFNIAEKVKKENEPILVSIMNEKEIPVINENILSNICEIIENKTPHSTKYLEGEFLENISRNFLSPTVKTENELTEMNLSLSDLELTEMNEDCLTDILNFDNPSEGIFSLPSPTNMMDFLKSPSLKEDDFSFTE
jgi:succinate dehydrogenase flavin-adding protein (antitoxin of CptAB toxin-antitoxin module)